MTRTWARELGRYKIRVNAVAPGYVATEILKAMPQKILDSMVEHTPLGRIGEPDDIANAYVWLASDAGELRHRPLPVGRRRRRGRNLSLELTHSNGRSRS